MFFIMLFLLLGAINGIIAGTLGIGGGSVIVPALVFIFSLGDAHPAYIQHMALATSMAAIIVTSVSSARGHHLYNCVRWDVVKQISVGIFLGTFLGSLVASYLSNMFLTVFFIVYLYLIAVQMIFNIKPKKIGKIPSRWGMNFVGGIIGTISSFVGIGGGSLSVPFLLYCNIPIHTAVGTSAAIGCPIAIAGTIGYIIGGWNVMSLQTGNLGYVNLLAFVCVSITSYITAPMGAKLAHKLPVKTLKAVFAIFLIVVASNMLIRLI